ncbi:MAG TPA: hypothetical protein VHH09_03315 [Acidimicrobiales bacterium]|nr:hypothetical protein [Acidimicrobiales bacterium]
MKRAARFLAVVLTASFLLMAPTAAGAASAGSVIIEGLTLAGTQFGTPSGQPTTVATDPLTIPVTTGDHFLYSTITCASPFPPWNSFGLQFDPGYPGITDPASVRHEIEGTVVLVNRSGTRGIVRGTITTYLCENGVRTDQIVSSFTATFQPTSATSVPLVGGGPVPTSGGLSLTGGFTITGGTGRFADLRGGGSMIGQFTCLASTLQRNGATSCADLGAFSEVPFQLRGRYFDPTA